MWQNAGKLFSGTLITAAIGLLSFAVSARALGPQAFGALALVFTFALAIHRLCSFQSWQAAIRLLAEAKASGESADDLAAIIRFSFVIDLIACAVACGLTLIVASWAGQIFGWSEAVESGVRWYALALLFSVEGAPTAVLRHFDRFDLIAWHRISGALVKLALVSVGAALSVSFDGFVALWILSHLGSYAILNSLAVHQFRQAALPVLQVRVPSAVLRDRKLWRFLLASNLDASIRVVREFDVQLVALWVDEAAAGLLRVARQIATLAGRLIDAYFEAGYPELARLAADKHWVAFRQFASRSALQSSALALLGLIAFLPIGEPALAALFGDAFVAAYPATAILLLAMVIWGLTQPYAPALLSLGAAGALTANHALAATIYLLVLISAVPSGGITAAAWALVALYTVWGSMTYMIFRWRTPSATHASQEPF